MSRLVAFLPLLALWAILLAVGYDLSVAPQMLLPWVMVEDAVVLSGAAFLVLTRR